MNKSRKLKIFVAYYDETQKPYINDLPNDIYIPWDVRFNNNSEFLELDLFRALLKNTQTFDDSELIGVFSWKFLHKTGIPEDYLMQEIDAFTMGDKDALILNPAIANNAIFANVFEQGVMCGHAKMSVIAKTIGLENIAQSVTSPEAFTMSSYIIATKRFWQQLVFYLEGMVNKCKHIAAKNTDFQLTINSSAGYARNPNLNYWPFLIERLVSVFLNNTRLSYKYIHPTELWFWKKFGGHSDEIRAVYDLKNACMLDSYFQQEWQKERLKILNNKEKLIRYFHMDDPVIDGIPNITLGAFSY